MFNRRTFSALTGAAAALGLGRKAGAAQSDTSKVKQPKFDIQPRGNLGRMERLHTQQLESIHDFLTDIMRFANNTLARNSRDRQVAIAKEKGLDLTKKIPYEDALKLFGDDPTIRIRDRVWHTAHNYEHQVLDMSFHADAEKYLAEMDAYDKAGPGTLELVPDMHLPDYVRHEIHQQPGGYVGNPFAGHIYHYATAQFYRGENDNDERHYSYAAATPLPADGQVRRVLDIGTGIGQLACTMKERFPDAEVHGVDVAAPMLRYGHMRAVDLGMDVHFKQRLAEETKYPDNHFDLVVSYILFHEVTAEAAKKIYAEAHRVLRPGGVFFPLDFNHKAPHSPSRAYSEWMDHRWNNEPWRLEYGSLDLAGEMRNAGFHVDDQTEPRGSFGRIIATKKA